MKTKPYKCPVCKASSCGDDDHTITLYKGPEKASGDRMKVMMKQVFDLLEIDNFQPYEIKALFNALVDEHVSEFEDE